MEDWSDEETSVGPAKARLIGFESEDDDSDVKESWDIESDEEPAPAKSEPIEKKAAEKKTEAANKPAPRQGKGKKLKQILKEKEAAHTEELLDPLAEKLRRQKLSEEADLELARATFIGSTDSQLELEELVDVMALEPNTRSDFILLSTLIGDRLADFSKSKLFPDFLDKMLRLCCEPMGFEEVKKLSTQMNVVVHEKNRIAKGTKGKGVTKKAASTPANRRVSDFGDFVGSTEPANQSTAVNNYDDFDDFM